jgi:hypothetical protein
MAWPVIGAVLGLGASVAGAVAQNQQTSQQRADVDRQLDQQFAQDKKVYEYNWEQSLREYEYLLEGINIKRAEEESVGQLKDQLAIDQYNFNKASQDFTFLNDLRQFTESEKIYGKQLSFNQIAAQQAASAERDKLRETLIASSFENQDMVVELLQQEGALQARGVSGRSVGRQLQGAMAAFGRNQAVLAESLVSARRQTGKNLERIDIEKYGADIAADANRMLMPMKGPDLPVPYRTPRATFQDPLAPQRGPEPIRGVNTATRASGLGIAATGLAATINAGNQIYNFYNPKSPII